MDAAALELALDELFDQALVHHGYTDYMRDYELIAYLTSDPRTGIAPTHRRFLFRNCVEATCRSTVHPDTWQVSLDDRLTTHETAADLDGFVWGVRWQVLYPGASIVPNSAPATRWSQAIGLDFHEVRVETNAHDLTLVFSDLTVTDVPLGYTPFTVTGG
ncbi:hypothetical protein SRB5_51910 [Streptomyces sp. RB5]|uniref:YxiG-like domain-containing protein n=1 Tax=Streptomyces smaragdinus TaxID=2585196 RepID=A0A7K0CQI0_9ACTN|nr:hypothetical protein [Streptomyces smaragdinus]MQY15014.1 hypothetical protein [Streptomyces smaragdinus]